LIPKALTLGVSQKLPLVDAFVIGK